ncbi:MAG: hypothetical protein GF363_17435 [Chitinivibrionales bacterium]|nr:hypothetical protein [Chitinivibrionales bacterium]
MLPLCFALLLITIKVSGAAESTFEREGNRYAYSVRLQSPIPPDSLIRMLFALDAVRRLSSQADTVFARDEDSLSYTVVMRFQFLGVEGSTSYRRTLHPTEDSISIRMLHFEHNWPLLPRPRQIDAWFVAEPGEGGSWLEYHQKVVVSRRVGTLYRLIIQRELREFAEILGKLVKSDKSDGSS